MCLCMPSFPFRNIITIDKNWDDTNEAPISVPARDFFLPQQHAKTWRPIISYARFPHHNYVHVRHTERIAEDETPAPPVFNGASMKYHAGAKFFHCRGFTAHLLRNRFGKRNIEENHDQIQPDTEKPAEKVRDVSAENYPEVVNTEKTA